MSIPLFPQSHRSAAASKVAKLLAAQEGDSLTLDFQNIVHVMALCAWARATKLTDEEVFEALLRMKSKKVKDLDRFEQFVLDQRTAASKSRATQSFTWTFYIPVNVILTPAATNPPPIRVLGVDFRLATWVEVESRLGGQVIDHQFTMYSYGPTPKKPATAIIVDAEGDKVENAWESVAGAFDSLRGVMEFYFGVGHGRDPYPDSPLSTFPRPNWMLVANVRGDVDLGQWEGERETRQSVTLSKSYLNGIVRDAEVVRELAAPKSTLALLADAFRLYAQAMDGRQRHDRLLGFWQMAESLVLSESFGGDTKGVCKRLSRFAGFLPNGLDTGGLPEILLGVADQRNDVVHRGLHAGVTNDQVNLLKTLCEEGLRWLVRVRTELPTQAHIEAFFSLSARYGEDLTVLTDVATVLTGTSKRQVNRGKSRV
jgi:hypothetical protein